METESSCDNKKETEVDSAAMKEVDESKEACESQDENDVEDEGRRMLLLRNALNKTTEKCVAANRFSLFAKTHPSMSRKHLKALQSIHKQLVERLKDAIHNEVETAFQEEKIPHLMNLLDKTIAEGIVEGDQPSWRPSGDADEDIGAHLIPVQLKMKERLQRILAGVEEDNMRQTKKVLALRQSISDTECEINKRVTAYNKLTEDIDQESMSRIGNVVAEHKLLH